MTKKCPDDILKAKINFHFQLISGPENGVLTLKSQPINRQQKWTDFNDLIRFKTILHIINPLVATLSNRAMMLFSLGRDKILIQKNASKEMEEEFTKSSIHELRSIT